MSFWINDEYLNEIWIRALGDPFPDERNPMEFHPSYSGCRDGRGKFLGTCTRKAYYSKTLPSTKEPDIAGEMMMDEGNIFETHAARVFAKAGVAVRPNAKDGQPRIMMHRVSPNGVPYMVVGRLDMIYMNAENHRAILDFKRLVTTNSAENTFGTSKWSIGGPEPKIQNVIQMAVYAEWGRDRGIFDCKLAYAHPPGRKGIVFSVKVDSEGNVFVDGNQQSFTLKNVYEDMDYLADCLDKDVVPERRYDLFYSDEELNRIAMKKDLPATWKAKKKKYGKINKNYGESPCAYCEFCSECFGAEDAAMAAQMIAK